MASTSSPTDSPMPGPGDPEKSKSRKRPRSRSPTEEPSNSIGDTQTLAGPPSSKRVRVLTPKRPSKRAKKPTAEYYKLKKNEVKDHALKSALEAHARSLWLIPGQTEVPPAVNQDDLKNYATRFSNVHQIDTSVANSIQDRRADRYNKAPEAVTVLKARLASLNGTIAAAINRISEEALLLMYRTVAGMGLERWNPDVSSPDPSSMYNLLHESICLRTFEQACAAQCYVSLGLDMALLKDHHHLQRLYRNFVFNTMHKVFKAELKVPGKAHQTVIMNGIYKRRKSLRDNRVETMQNNGFHAHFLRMGDLNEAHSDDEKVESIISVQPSPSTATTAALSSTSSSQPSGSRPSAGSSASTTATTYVIKTIPGRARKVGKVWRALDEKRKKADARKRRITTRIRSEPEEPQESTFTSLPKGVPLDFFDPDFFNEELDDQERLDIIKDGVTIGLPDTRYCETWEEIKKWKNLPYDEFMAEYGQEVLKQYTLPTEEEIQKLLHANDPESDSGADADP